MSALTIEAIFHEGALCPLEPTGLKEGERVQLAVRRGSTPTPDEILTLASEVYAGLSAQDVQDLERIALRSEGFFSARAEDP